MDKVCNKCKENKNILNFRQCKYSNNKNYFKSFCKKCESKIQVQRARNKKLTDEQKEKRKKYLKNYKIKNKDKINKKYKEKLISNINFKLRKNISRHIYGILKKNNLNKSHTSILNFLGYSIEDLKNHLEKQFDKNMNWSNYGIYWHIDHIIPQSCLIYEKMEDENFKKCWSLNNLRPLDAKTNMLDGATRIRHKK